MIDQKNMERIRRRVKRLVAEGKVRPALAAGARSDETTQLAQSEGRQSGGSESERNAPNQSSLGRNNNAV